MTATGANGHSLKAAATVNVTPIPALTIDTNTVSAANAGTLYSDSLSASGGASPYRWSVSLGALPVGIQLATTGTIAGTTASTGSFPFVAKVTDSTGSSTVHSYTLSVSPSSSTSSTSTSGYDGPAELPRVLIPTAMANTPAPGTTITVNSGGNLQSALNNASCGDTIQLQAGATFAGAFTFPAKSCDDNHWIIVRTSADDSALPAEGSRLKVGLPAQHFPTSLLRPACGKVFRWLAALGFLPSRTREEHSSDKLLLSSRSIPKA